MFLTLFAVSHFRSEEEQQPSGTKVIDLKEFYRLYVGVEQIR